MQIAEINEGETEPGKGSDKTNEPSDWRRA